MAMTKRVLRYFAILLSLSSAAFSINSPEIGCVMVLANGNVNLTWAIPPDPFSEFQSYEVYSATNVAGPYSPAGSISTYNTNSWPVSCNANAQPYYFYVRVLNTAGQLMLPVDTVRTINLIMTSPANSSVASFSWNNFHSPLPSGVASVFKIYREYPSNSWTQVGTVPTHNSAFLYSYNDTINVCSDSIHYRVELFDSALSCTSMSNVKGDRFVDNNSPAPSMLDSVSVDVNGNVTMGIHPSFSSDVKCFVIWVWTGATYKSIDTVCTNNMPTVYTYTNATANSSSQMFSVAAIDSCGNISVIASNNQTTIYLQGSFDVCTKVASLSWNAYTNMTGGVHHYEILCSVNGGPYNHVADTTALVYFHKNLTQGVSYCYRVRAHSILKNALGKDLVTSSSNIFCVNPTAAVTPSYVYLSNATVNNPSEDVTVKWSMDNTVKVGGFTIHRADNLAGPYSYIGSATYYSAISNYSFVDSKALATKQKYFYFVRVLDTCNSPIMRTDTSNTILLTASPTGNFHATLNWTDYAKWPGGVTGYNIYRSLDGVFSGTPIATVAFGTNTYVDDLSNYTTYQGKFSYYVEALEGTGNPYGLMEKSESNLADVYLDVLMFVPNAFVPKGQNKIFLPIGDYVEKTDFKLSIFNRWGDKIYQTTDENQGWDGGENKEGLYGYVIEYKNAMGEYRQQQGTVTLVR
jgi:gliding motility-associated-like protein